ncbi:O-acetyl-ADP-ribose deacetylase [Paenibacillus sp. CMAA1739]|uniref:O-acetyl-ADP-ribose deacetylase n=1 Tax=Paenibacillus ottowii TaxID=2315729 RepID=UPI0027321601|nr:MULTISPECIES: O-acetyl-ADP-ribose deacetylase [Paenibacillus]MDP1511130.1 O-acetyl-ADP-ribose deacetylase [Paenibacillus ottowii]MEC4566372.1 O-acetyl-ADP-ribose deacetylase [Paenibacillus sp. CMAA1739]
MDIEIELFNVKIRVVQGDITRCKTDIIVNAANTSLLGGGGVDGAIHRAGGPTILEDCVRIRNKQGGCPVGGAVYTTAGMLDAQYVIHTVGPVWNGGDHHEEELLATCYRHTLQLALELNARSIAFPNISTGIYRFPKEKAAEIAIQEVTRFVQEHTGLNEIIFVCFDIENAQLYSRKLQSSKD